LNLIKIKYSCANDTIKKMKWKPTGENICKSCIWKSIISIIYKEILKLNDKKQTTQLKNGPRIWIHISLKIYKWLTSTRKDVQYHEPSGKCSQSQVQITVRYHFTFPPAMFESSYFSTPLTFVVIFLFYYKHASGCEVVSYCNLDLWLTAFPW